MYDAGIISVVTPAGSEPVGLDEMKAHLRVDDTNSDGEIIGMMIAARQLVEAWLGRALITQTLDWFLPGFRGCFRVPRPPLVSVTHLKYLDTNGAEQTVDAANYSVIAPAGPTAAHGTIDPAYQFVWPPARGQRDAVRIRFVAGYGGPEKVPDAIRSALKLLVGDLYENREAQIVGTIVAENVAVMNLLAPFRMSWL